MQFCPKAPRVMLDFGVPELVKRLPRFDHARRKVDLDLGKDSLDCVGLDQRGIVCVDVFDAAIHTDFWGRIFCFSLILFAASTMSFAVATLSNVGSTHQAKIRIAVGDIARLDWFLDSNHCGSISFGGFGMSNRLSIPH